MNLEFVVDASSDSSNMTWTVPTASDNSGVVGLSANIDPGTVLVVGEYIVTYTATDSSGLTDNCTFTLSVLGKMLFLYLLLIIKCICKFPGLHLISYANLLRLSLAVIHVYLWFKDDIQYRMVDKSWVPSAMLFLLS